VFYPGQDVREQPLMMYVRTADKAQPTSRRSRRNAWIYAASRSTPKAKSARIKSAHTSAAEKFQHTIWRRYFERVASGKPKTINSVRRQRREGGRFIEKSAIPFTRSAYATKSDTGIT
jgi:hypothetical protein